ncbi:low affinity iron permease family protein [Caulobacter segnis]|uniref:Low affinity iron permease family protein n=2 Tax=Caulobacter segnis TaxID=88688 RepID=D5VMM4_CAUST|nr:low affinity iron permease family protein [Caulobacter segnis]ADG11747.1 protein of unknown function DUF1452 [Caulobacter segnis ATCC 21756]AVQ03388.1 low affinity iron permease family protein [Caulobacter segnis]
MDKLFAKFANVTARITGSPPAFLVCVAVVLLWAVSGPLFGFSETWQLVINTGTTIVTFLMVFLIQNTQNRDGVALQTKLDELIRATTDAENEFIGIEKLTDKELEVMHARCKARADRSMRALRQAAAEKDARMAKSKSRQGARAPSAKARAASRAKALKAGRASE